jgi:multidomain signaling protein FimX
VSDPAVPLIVVSSTRDPVEALNSLLRKQGIPAHCTWIPALHELPDALQQLNPEMLVCVTQDGSELPTVVKVRDGMAQDLPLLIIRPESSEALIAADLAIGARDSISLNNHTRAHAVIARELKARRIEKAMQSTLRTANEYRKQLETVLTRSNDAIAQVQEGILVEANAAWLDLVGAPDAGAVVGQPVMDFFEDANHAALKGAIVACLQGRWNDHSLRAAVQTADGGTLSLELMLTLGERDGEACVHVVVPSQKRNDKDMATDLAEAVRRNPRSGLLYRHALLETLQKRLETAVQGGSRYILSIRPDNFAKLERELGAVRSEEFVVELASLLRAQTSPSDLLGHFNGSGVLAMIERGTARDAELWAERIVEKVAKNTFEIDGKRIKVSVCVGLAALPNSEGKLEAAISDALEAVRNGRQRGGNRTSTIARTDTDARVQAYDAVWVKHIRAALTGNRFRLVQQPIASLAGGDEPMFDMLVRMLDHQNKEILPSEFMPAAERNNLVAHIDRWVFLTAARFAAKTKPGCLFVRLSKASALDATLSRWMEEQLRSLGVEPKRLCVQVTEDLAARHPAEILQLANGVRHCGLRFALEHFGSGIDPLSLLTTLPLDFVKIDGSLMQGLIDDSLLQSKVSTLVDSAREKDIETIAERVEDANTMAVLWQLGVQHLQGFLIQAPEEVVMSAPEASGQTATVPVLAAKQS